MADTLPPVIAILQADSTDFDDKIDDAIAKLQEFKAAADDVGNASLGVDDTEAQAKLDDLDAKLDEFGEKHETATADIDTDDAREGTEALDGDLERLNMAFAGAHSASDDASGGLESFDDSVDESGNHVDDFKKKVDAASGKDGSGGGLGGLWTAALVLTPALAGIGEVATAGIVGLSGAIVGAGAGLGLFALAAKNELPGVESQIDSLVTAFGKANEASVMPALQGVIPIIRGALSGLSPVVTATAGALDTLEQHAQTALAGPVWQGFVTFLTANAGPAITSFGTLLGGLGGGFAGLLEAFQPVITSMEKGLADFGTKFEAWGQNLASDPGFQTFLHNVEQMAPEVGQLLDQLGKDFGTLVQDASNLGPGWLDVLNVLAKIIGALENFSPVLTEVVISMVAFGAAASKIGTAFGAIDVAGFAGKISGLAGGLLDLGAKAGISTGVIDSLGVGLATIGGGTAAAIVGIVALSAALLASGSSSTIANSELDSFQKGFLQSFVSQIPAGVNQLHALNSEISSLGTQMKQTADGPQWTKLNDEQTALIYGYQQLTKTQGQVTVSTQAQTAATAAQQQVMATLNATTTPAQQAAQMYTSAIGAVTSASSAESSALSQVNSVLTALIGNTLDAESGANNFQAAINNLNSQLATNKGAIAGTSQAAVTDRQAVDSVAQSILTQIPLLVKQGDSAAQVKTQIDGMVGSLDQQLAAAGLTAAQIQAYNAQLGLTPKNITTVIATVGASGAVQDAQNVLNALDKIPTSKTISIIEQVIGSGAAAAAGNPTGGANNAFAVGGIVTHAQIAIVGEAGPEAILPLTDMTRSAQILQQAGIGGVSSAGFGGLGGGLGGGQAITLNMPITIQGNATQQTAQAIQQAVASEFNNLARQLALIS